MGSINRIWNPIYWKICLEGKSKIIENDTIYKMIIGNGEDYQYYEIIEFISKDNYESVINGKYSIAVFPYSELSILLFNEQQELIPLLKGENIAFEKLSQIQKEYIANLNKEKKLLKQYERK